MDRKFTHAKHRCRDCDALFDSIHQKLGLRVIPVVTRLPHECCVGFVELLKTSFLQGVDILSFEHTIQHNLTEGCFRLLVSIAHSHTTSLVILPDRRCIEIKTKIKDARFSIKLTWQKGQPRICLLDENDLKKVTLNATGTNFTYTAVKGSNLGNITFRNPDNHPTFDLTARVHHLKNTRKYNIRGVWCYFNPNVLLDRFSVEVVTGEGKIGSDEADSPRFYRVFPYWIATWSIVPLVVTTKWLWSR